VGTAHPLHPLQVPAWKSIPGLVHGFCGRRGGVSRGDFAELNLSFRVGDAPAAVRENWRRVTDMFASVVQVVTMRQVHGTRVTVVPDGRTDPGEADGMVTRSRGVALGVLTADCVPILLAVPLRRTVAAIHAGWRGTVAGIAPRAVAYLAEQFDVTPAEILAALGPAIGGCCYEVDHDIVDELQQHWGAMPEAIVRQGRAKARLDLRRANAGLLTRAGVRPAAITTVGPCTQCSTSEYFSYRGRRAATGRPTTGRQLSFIGWQD
jgi:YfiH family protein